MMGEILNSQKTNQINICWEKVLRVEVLWIALNLVPLADRMKAESITDKFLFISPVGIILLQTGGGKEGEEGGGFVEVF